MTVPGSAPVVPAAKPIPGRPNTPRLCGVNHPELSNPPAAPLPEMVLFVSVLPTVFSRLPLVFALGGGAIVLGTPGLGADEPGAPDPIPPALGLMFGDGATDAAICGAEAKAWIETFNGIS